MSAENLLLLDESLSNLAECDPSAAKFVELHGFAGLSIDLAAALGLARRTAYRDWNLAKAWLDHEIQGSDPPQY